MLLERLFFTGNQKFFIIFNELALQARKMSSLLLACVTNCDNNARLYVNEMKEVERLTAEQTHALFMELGRNLITPFDREDIHFLATDLSNITRNVLHVTKQIRNYDIDGGGGVTEIVVRQIDEAVGMLAQILNKLNDVQGLMQLTPICTTIGTIVHTCDDLLDTTVAKLLEDEKNELQLVKMMDHYASLQKLLGKIGDTVNVCESIIIKYS